MSIFGHHFYNPYHRMIAQITSISLITTNSLVLSETCGRRNNILNTL